MNGKDSHVVCAVLAIVSMTAGLPVGCAGFPRLTSNKTNVVPPTAKPDANPAGFSDAEQAALMRVTQYIERTSEYELDGAAASLPPTPVSTAGSPPLRAELASPAASDPERPTSSEPPNAVERRPSPSREGMLANVQVTLPAQADEGPKPALPVVMTVAIRPPLSVEVPTAEPAKRSATNEPLNVHPLETPLSLDRLVEHLESKTGDEPDFDTEWQLKLLQLALNRDADATRISPALSGATRRILSALTEAIVAVRAAARNPALVPLDTVGRAEALRAALAEGADPAVSAVELCRRVVTFGVYDEMEDEDFRAGQTLQTIVYCEIQNFRSEPTPEGWFRTKLAARLEVLSEQGQSMWEHEEPEIIDVCRRRRTDFFLAQRIAVPATLPEGEYVLKVLVEDKLSGRADEATHRFRMTGPASLAIRR